MSKKRNTDPDKIKKAKARADAQLKRMKGPINRKVMAQEAATVGRRAQQMYEKDKAGKNVPGHKKYNKAVDKYNKNVQKNLGKGSGSRNQSGGMGRGTKKKGGGKSYRSM